jgi:hypothetical protein
MSVTKTGIVYNLTSEFALGMCPVSDVFVFVVIFL